MANIQEIRTGIGFKKQVALHTALLAADVMGLRQTSRGIGQPIFNNEDDANDIGKGDSWASEVFPSHLDANWSWEAYLTSENAALAAAFALGKAVKVAAGTGWKYTCTPFNPITDGIDMPATTVVQSVRQGASDVFDFALIGMCCEEFGFSFKSGPGRANATMRSSWVGSGAFANPSGIVIPATATEHALNSGGATTVSINGVNYIANKRFVSLDMNYKNNIRMDSGYYPGSGAQNNYNLRGRMRQGAPSASLGFVAEFENGSTELDAMLAGTEGTAQIVIPGAVIGAGPSTHKLDVTFHRVRFKGTPISDTDGLITVAVDCSVMKHNANGVITVEVTTETDNILTQAV